MEKLCRRELTAGAPAQRGGSFSSEVRDILSASEMMTSQCRVIKSPHCLLTNQT